MAQIDVATQATVSIATPTTGVATVFIDSASKKLKVKDDAGLVTDYSNAAAAITSLTGDVTGTGPGATATAIADAVVTSKLLTGLASASGTPVATDTVLQAFGKLLSKLNSSHLFGTGVDGIVTITVDTTLIRDMYYDTLTINPGINLFTGGFRIFVFNTLTIGTGGVIDRSGISSVAQAGGAALVAGTLGLSGAGGAGGNAAVGVAGTSTTNSASGSGGAGGAGSAGAGGAAGTATVPTAITGGIEQLNSARSASVVQTLSGITMTGGAGGGGGGGGTTTGGGGGSGGGVISISARTLTGTGSVKAVGGNGFSALGVNGGGGAGGGGGTICTVTENDTLATSLVFTVSGGVGASGNGTGIGGANGSVGRIFHVRS